MKQERYITEKESAKCKCVMNAFMELYEQADIVVLDAGRYGFVVLEYFDGRSEFNTNTVYNNSAELFEDLWESWLNVQLIEYAKGTPILELDYEEIFKRLPIERQKELMGKRKYFADQAGISLEGNDI